MKFNDQERSVLLGVKGVGPTVIKRLEEIGISSFKELKKSSADDIVEIVASMLNSTCWKNSPKTRNAISSAIERANAE